MSRRTRTEAGTGGGAVDAGADLLSAEMARLIETWPARDRRLLTELFEDTGSELQRELLRRAVVARNGAAALHAFADEIRGMGDEELYEACTVGAERPLPVTQRFRAEADPLFAMQLNGHPLSPRLEDDPGPAFAPPDRWGLRRFHAPPALLVPVEPPRVEPGPPPSFEGESSTARGRPLLDRELGLSGEELPAPPRPAPPAAGSSALLNEAVRGLGICYREQAVDTGELTLDRALEEAATALTRGIPVPVTLGRRAGELGRQVLMLQVTPAGKARAFELHDPFAGETVWANERDLLGRTELPFDAKVWRRITQVALPLPGKR